MTAALCLSCGEIKSGALNPCSACTAGPSGNTDLDILFSDHHYSLEILEDFGAVIYRINAATNDKKLQFWTFIYYVSEQYPEDLKIQLDLEMLKKAQEVLHNQVLSVATLITTKK